MYIDRYRERERERESIGRFGKAAPRFGGRARMRVSIY